MATARQLKERLAWQADHDALTGLRNRLWFMNGLHERFMVPTETGPILLFLELDNFKRINDGLGHEAGDLLLMQLAGRLREASRGFGTPVRLGGDEFTLLLEPDRNRQDAIAVAERIIHSFATPFVVSGYEVFVTSSMGIAQRRPEHLEPADLLRDADLAHDWARNQGKARYALFEPRMNRRALERLRLETDLRRALLRQEFQIYYQPILDLGRAEIVGFEALVRWQHPQRGMVSPGEFIPLAEESGLIVEIGDWVLEEACRQMKRWQESCPGWSRLFVSVNISPRQGLQPELIKRVAEVLIQTELPPNSLQLEITEGVAMGEEEELIESLAALRRLGVRLAMDDFGTGYSSFSYLRRFPFEVLKIAQPFVKALGQDAEATAIVRAMVALAKALNLAVTAEGVESPWQLEMLRELGCDTVQGFYLGRPLPVDETTALLSLWFDPTEALPLADRSPVL